MDEMPRHGELGPAALRAGMSPNTARRYVRAGRLPSELTAPRGWRTRTDPFAADWAELRARLVDAPELEATTLFEDLLRRKPDGYTPGQLRTLQRRVKQWRAQEGPPKQIFFPLAHRPGEAMQTDFTLASALGITIRGEPCSHRLCHPVPPYSKGTMLGPALFSGRVTGGWAAHEAGFGPGFVGRANRAEARDGTGR